MTDCSEPVVPNPWSSLRRYIDARIALGRAGGSLPTGAPLAFKVAHAQARDAVHLPMDTDALSAQLDARGRERIRLHSAAPDRLAYLKRPDLGRRLNEPSQALLAGRASAPGAGLDVVFVIADGLSARATRENAIPLLDRVLPELLTAGWRVGPIAIVEQGRVVVGDKKCPFGRAESWSAAYKLRYLLDESRCHGLSGVSLKEDAHAAVTRLAGADQAVNFILPPDKA